MASIYGRHFDTQSDLRLYFLNIKTQFRTGYELEAALQEIEFHAFRGRDLADIVSALGYQYHRMAQQSLTRAEDFREAIRNNMDPWLQQATNWLRKEPQYSFFPGDSCRILLGFALLGMHPGDHFMQRHKTLLMHHLRSGQIDKDHLIKLDYAYATLGEHPGDDVMARLIGSSDWHLKKDGYTESAQGTLAQNIATLDVLSPSQKTRSFATDLLARFDPGKDGVIKRPWLFAARHFGISLGKDIPYQKETPSVSATERAFASVVRKVVGEADFSDQELIKGIAHRPDMMVRKLIIELDGPSHFIDGMLPNGSTILMTDLMHRRRPDATIIRLPDSIVLHWIQCGERGFERVVEAFVDAAEKLPSGAYLYCNGHGGFQPMFTQTEKGLRYRPVQPKV